MYTDMDTQRVAWIAIERIPQSINSLILNIITGGGSSKRGAKARIRAVGVGNQSTRSCEKPFFEYPVAFLGWFHEGTALEGAVRLFFEGIRGGRG